MGISSWRPGRLLLATLAQLALLVLLLLSWWYKWFDVDRLPQEIGGVLPLLVPWGGALGGVTITLVGLSAHWGNWPDDNGNVPSAEGRKWNAWYLLRPLVGTILGSMGALMLVLLLGSIATTDSGDVDTSPRGVAILATVGFVLGYRQQAFASLLGRVLDVILGPGETTPTTGFTVSPNEVTFPTTVGTAKTMDVVISNTGTRLLQLPRSAFQLSGTDSNLFKVSHYPGNLGKGQIAMCTLTYEPTSAGTHTATLTISGGDSTQSVALSGTTT